MGWNIEIYSTLTNQFDWSVSRTYVINIIIYIHIIIYHAKSRLNTPVWGSLRLPNYVSVYLSCPKVRRRNYVRACSKSVLGGKN